MNTRANRRPARVVAVLALTAPMAVVVISATAATSYAGSGNITKPAADTIVTSGSSVVVEASVSLGRGETAKLQTTGPGSSNPTTTKQNTCTSVLTCPSSQSYTLTQSPTVDGNADNGQFTITLTGPGISASRSFYTNFAPTADPGNLAAAPIGRTEVDLSWSYTGTEPDKAGFEIVETHAGATRTFNAPASACSGTSCGYAVTGYTAPAEGTTEDFSYTVTALRSSGGCGSCGAYTRSNPSSSAGAQLVGPPPPPPPPPPPSDTTGGTTGSGTTSGGTTGDTTGSSTGGSAGGSTGGSTGSSTGGSTGGSAGGTTGSSTGASAGGTTGTHSGTTTGSKPGPKQIIVPKLPPIVASRRAFALGFNSFSPSLGIPKLPPLPATTFPVTSPSSDTYQPTLPYANSSSSVKKTTNVLSSPIAAVKSLGLDTNQLARCLAVALLLLACAAHVRVFMGRSAEE